MNNPTKKIITHNSAVARFYTRRTNRWTTNQVLFRSYHFLAHGGGGAGGNGGGSSKYNRLKRGDQEKNNVIEGGIKHFCSTASKKNRMGTFDAATRTALHFSRVDQGYLSCYFYLKTFKYKKKYFRIQIVRQILTHFFQKKR